MPLRSLAPLLLAAALLAGPQVRADAPTTKATTVEAVGHLARPGAPTVLHFWATWCTACQVEFPRIRPALQQLQAGGARVILVAIEQPGTEQRADEALARFQMQGFSSLLLDAPDPALVARALGDKAWEGVLPATFVFDASGHLSRSFRGMAAPSRLRAAVRKASGPSPRRPATQPPAPRSD